MTVSMSRNHLVVAVATILSTSSSTRAGLSLGTSCELPRAVMSVRLGPAATNAAAASRQRWTCCGDPSKGVFADTM